MSECDDWLRDLHDEIEVLTLALLSAPASDERLQLRTRLRASLRVYVDMLNTKIAMAGYPFHLAA